MARCEGTTASGERCKLEARAGSRFCHIHQPADEAEEKVPPREEKEEQDPVDELGDLIPLLLAGAAAAGLLLVIRSFGKWMPRL